jgi:hypothetical protein
MITIKRALLICYMTCVAHTIIGSDTAFSASRFTSITETLSYANESRKVLQDEQSRLLREARDVVNKAFFELDGVDLTVKPIHHMPLIKNPVLNQSGTLLAGISDDKKNKFVVADIDTGKYASKSLKHCTHVDFGIQEKLIFSTDTIRVGVMPISGKCPVKADIPFPFGSEQVRALAAHKQFDRIAVATFVYADKTSVITVRDYDKRICSWVANGIVASDMIKWHPVDTNILAVKTEKGISLYDIRNSGCARHVLHGDIQHSTGEFDFNEDGTQFCATHRDNYFCMGDTRMSQVLMWPLIETIPGSIMRNIGADFFIYQAIAESPGRFSITSTHDFMHSLSIAIHPKNTYGNGTFLPNKATGQLFFYRAQSGSAEMKCLTFSKMIGTKIKDIKPHNFACIYALSQAKNDDDRALLKSPEYEDALRDTAAKDACFNATFSSL